MFSIQQLILLRRFRICANHWDLNWNQGKYKRLFASINSYPRGYWEDAKNQRDFFDRIGRELQIKDSRDWYRVKTSDVLQRGGAALINGHFGGSLHRALKQVYPEFQLQSWKFEQPPKGYWKQKEHQLSFFDWFSKEFAIENKEDWYRITRHDFEQHGGLILLDNYYGGSLGKALQSLYPDTRWQLWRFHHIQGEYWQDTIVQKEFMVWISQELSINKLDDWYHIKVSNFVQKGGTELLTLFDNSLFKILQNVYPQHSWSLEKYSKFYQSSKESWNDVQQQREFFDWLGKKFLLEKIEDWFYVTNLDINDRGGSFILPLYNGSLLKALLLVYNNSNWNFSLVPSGFWNSLDRQRAFFDWQFKQHKLTSWKDWYKVPKGIEERSVLALYGSSFSHTLQNIYPEYEWETWRFGKVPQGYWEDLKNQRSFFDGISTELCIMKPEDWYQVKYSEIERKGGDWIAYQFGGSGVKAIQAVYPEYHWLPWRFQHVPKGFWQDDCNAKMYLEWLADRLNIKNLDDWKEVTLDPVNALKGASLIRKHRGLLPLLRHFFPHHSWTRTVSKRSGKAQIYLWRRLKNLFPTSDVLLNYRHQDIVYQKTSIEMELDVFIPSLEIAFEYQGLQHYGWHFKFGSPEAQQQRDKEKREACLKAGITLIEVPFWWDFRLESLVAVIRKERPDLLKDMIIDVAHSSISKVVPQSHKRFVKLGLLSKICCLTYLRGTCFSKRTELKFSSCD